MIRISIRDVDQFLHIAYEEGRQAIINKRKNPHIANPYIDGTDSAEAWEKGMKEQLEKSK